MEPIHATTILLVRKDKQVVMASDGQVTLGHSVMKNNAEKIRLLYNNTILSGFAGSTADAFTLFENFEARLKKHQGHIMRAAVELTRAWRNEKAHIKLETMLIVSDAKTTLILSGNGDVIEPEHPIIAIGSGGNFAQAAAIALYKNTKLSAKAIAQKSMEIAADICIYTNHHIHFKTLEIKK